ncbi:homing endonuclease associated repeat-containing protein [Bacillus thuringiensis]|uniref:homing endonuclease associated repeat-containing protein n=3 Tax=Bacillus thuringiensis TaxID=1428 RepID=UPI0035D6B731
MSRGNYKTRRYSKEELIEIIQEKAKTLNRTPKRSEIKEACSVVRVFGSFSDGIIAAGLKPTRRKFNRKPCNETSKQEIIIEIQNKAEELGRTPRNCEVDIGKIAINKFGSWNKALQAAGLEVNQKSYTRSEIIQLFQEYAKENKRTPRQCDLSINDNVYRRIFGSWSEAVRAAGLTPNTKKTDQELLQELKRVSKELGKVPTVTECHKIKFYVSTYQIRFGSWNKALELAGLAVKNPRRCRMTTEQYLDLLKNYATKLGRVPLSREIQEARTIIERFGSWNKALEAAGLATYKRECFTKEDCIVLIQEKAKALGRVPKIEEMTKISTIYKKFGSWKKALEAAGLPVLQKREYTKEELIEIIQEKARELHRTPKINEIKHVTLIRNEFGSWKKALEAAGLPALKKRGYTKEELIKIIQEKARELHRAPKSIEIKQSTSIYRKFGSWNKVLEAAGLATYKRECFTKEDCIVLIQEKAKALGRIPKIEEMTKISIIYKKFGSWKKALEAAGLATYKRECFTKEDCIVLIQEKAKALGRTPKIEEMTKISIIYKKFGSWKKALEAAGLPALKKRGYTKEELIEIIQEKARELHRAPKSTEIKQSTSIYRKFGSWNKVLEAAGLSNENH